MFNKGKRKSNVNPNDPTDRVTMGSGIGSAAVHKPNSGVSAIFDKDTSSLPNIIWSFRNGRKDSVGYDDPTYFGFALDIHSQSTEASEIFNPYTGVRANPLFYQPSWANLAANGSGIMDQNDDDTKFPDLTASPSEACAIQYLTSYTLPLDKTKDFNSAKGPILKASADALTKDRLDNLGGTSALTRGYYLMEFIKTLNYIQEKTPWSITEIDGVNNLWKATYPKHNFAPVELTFTANETVDLRITKLAENYRLATYDSFNDRKVIAPNLEKFSMDIYLMDMRFIKSEIGGSPLFSFGSSTYESDFSAQVNFGGIAFRCMGCRFDFSGFFDQATQFKSATADAGFQPKFKIIIDRVIPATYFGDKSFGFESFSDEPGEIPGAVVDALGGALDLGPFTGGVTRVLSAGRRALTNILGAPQRALNDALRDIERRFDADVNNFLEGTGPLNSRPFEKKTAETLINERKTSAITNDMFEGVDVRTGLPIKTDMFPGKDTRTVLPIKNDMFPGKDTRTVLPINADAFPGVDVRSSNPIKQDVYPGNDSRSAGVDVRTGKPINQDVYPGDVPVLTTINQRKVGGKITSQNPYKL